MLASSLCNVIISKPNSVHLGLNKILFRYFACRHILYTMPIYSVHLLVSGLLSDPMPGASTGENIHKNIPSSLQGELPCDIFYVNEQTDSLQAFQVSD